MMYDEVEPTETEKTTENSMTNNKENAHENNKENFKQNVKENAKENTKESAKEENLTDEKKTNQVNMEQPDSIEYRISIENGSAKWLEDEKEETLQNINMKVRPGELIAIVGQVGAGKSSLLNVILKELRLQEGSIQVCSLSLTINVKLSKFEDIVLSENKFLSSIWYIKIFMQLLAKFLLS